MQNLYPLDYPASNGGQLGNNPDTGTFGSGYDNPSVEENPDDILKRFLYKRVQEKKSDKIKLKALLDNKIKKKLEKYPEPLREIFGNKYDLIYGFAATIGMFGPWLLPICNILYHHPELIKNVSQKSEFSTQEIGNFIDKVADSKDAKTVDFSAKDKEVGNWLTNKAINLISNDKVKQYITNQVKEIQNIVTNADVKDTTKSYTSNQTQKIQSTDNIQNINKNGGYSDKLINFIKNEENDSHKGYDEKTERWYPHISLEGGRPTIGYGHKIKSAKEQNKYEREGLTTTEVNDLLIQDLNDAKNTLYQNLRDMGYKNVKLNNKQEEMLLDFVYNLGSIKKFPKFTKAVINNDINGMRKEYERSYQDADGVWHKVERRNKDFYNTFLR